MSAPRNEAEPQPGRRRGLRWRGLIQAVVGLGALALVIFKTDLHALTEAFHATQISYLPLALAATVATNWLMAYRWKVILSVRGHEVKTARLFVYYLIGVFFSNFVPGGTVTGDVARLIYASRDVKDKPFVLSTLIYERLTGMMVLLMIGLTATLTSRIYRPEGNLFYMAEAALALAFLASAILMSGRASSLLARWCRALGNKFRLARAGDAASRTLEAIASLRQYKRMFVATVLLSIAIRVVWSLGCYAVARAMDLPLSLPVIFAFISLVDLIRMLPVSVGGLGVREWTMIVLFANVGLAREQALLYSLLAFAPLVLTAITGGIVYISQASVLRVEEQTIERAV
ncbi:MAG TPA: lysylphosphatidylglycerol synthase transmembrane domain-containing protein [Blastocatellia bacterium]